MSKLEKRKLEWSKALYFLTFGLFLTVVMNVLNESYVHMTGIMPEAVWGVLFIFSGVGIAVSLWVNGRAWWTPFLRLAAFFAASQAFLTAGFSIINNNAYSFAGWTFVFLAVVDCGFSMWSAALDCGREMKIREKQKSEGNG